MCEGRRSRDATAGVRFLRTESGEAEQYRSRTSLGHHHDTVQSGAMTGLAPPDAYTREVMTACLARISLVYRLVLS